MVIGPRLPGAWPLDGVIVRPRRFTGAQFPRGCLRKPLEIRTHHVMKLSHSLVVVFLFSLTASYAETLIVTLDSVARRVRAQNPDLAAARLQIREAAGKHLQAGRLTNPNVEFSFEHDARFRERAARIGLTQQFPVTQRLIAEKQVTAAMVDAAAAEVANAERKLIAEAQQATVKALAIREQRALRQRQIEVANEFADFISKAAAKGESSPVDAGQAKVEAARLTIGVRQLDAQETDALGTLKNLLGVRIDEALQVSGKLPGLRDALPQARGERADLQAARAEADAAQRNIALEQAKRRGDVEAGIFASSNREEDAPDGFGTETMVGLQFKIPLPWWDNNQGNIAAAAATAQRKQLETKAVKQAIRIEGDATRAEMQQWAKLVIEMNDQLLPLARKQADDAAAAFRNGQGELQTVLRSRDQALELDSARIDALRDFHLARIRYASAVGAF